jgi:hypothetical protein
MNINVVMDLCDVYECCGGFARRGVIKIHCDVAAIKVPEAPIGQRRELSCARRAGLAPRAERDLRRTQSEICTARRARLAPGAERDSPPRLFITTRVERDQRR